MRWSIAAKIRSGFAILIVLILASALLVYNTSHASAGLGAVGVLLFAAALTITMAVFLRSVMQAVETVSTYVERIARGNIPEKITGGRVAHSSLPLA